MNILVLIPSRGRRKVLDSTLRDIEYCLLPVTQYSDVKLTVGVFLQNDELVYSNQDFRIHCEPKIYSCIGEVYEAMFSAFSCELSDCDYVFLLDDDTAIYSTPLLSENFNRLFSFLSRNSPLACSIRLGYDMTFRVTPMISSSSPYIPFKEKFMVVSPKVITTTIESGHLNLLGVGEDVYINLMAIITSVKDCYSIHGFGSFHHLSFEGSSQPLEGGLKLLYANAYDSEDKYEYANRELINPLKLLPEWFDLDKPDYLSPINWDKLEEHVRLQ